MSSQKNVVFVTGCTEGGIGASICLEYAENGATVYAGVRKLEALGSLANDKRIQPIIIDVTKDETVIASVQKIIEEAGQIDILVNNAGVNAAAGLSIEVPIERYKQTFEVNVSVE